MAKKSKSLEEFLDPANRTEAEQRFYDLRESGYRGPVDENGYADPDDYATVLAKAAARKR
jgi:hypothetical protein